MAEPLEYVDNGDGTITLTNDPVPEQIVIDRILWGQMVDSELPWAVVTQDEDNTQHLAVMATNVTALFDWAATGPGKTTIMDTVSWA